MSDVQANHTIPEPIAIIGIGCHYPGGATSPRAFWNLLRTGVDATRDVPGDRWDVRKFYDPDVGKSGKMHTFRGGYLDRIDQFDAHFFGISPREAIWLDPQQRLLLQVLWEALEDAGQVADRLRGSDTGVFVGGFTLDYQLLQNYGVLSRYEFQANSATGMMMTMLANRLSYVFDFRGPSMAVDTACSGSLVAVHLAARSIWNGECSLAVAGGANLMIAPTMAIVESKGGFLAPDGRCKTFDSSANGYARGEGAGVVVLKPLTRAIADRDPVYALIRGTAVSQDGHTTGITVPNQAAQEAAMRAAYRVAGIAPSAVQYVEAHGTGTPVGDPIEARAIGSVVSEGRPAGQHCQVGSVKTNIGHLEAAAGVAGLTKAALALRHGQIPPHLHLHDPNPEIPFEELQLCVPTGPTEWPRDERPRYAGVNSFGFGGTNAHVVLEEAPPASAALRHPDEGERPHLLPLSARSGDALVALARSYRDFLATDPHHLNDVGYSAGLRRDHHEHRLAVVACSTAEAIEKLDAFLDGSRASGTSTGRAQAAGRPRIAFVCSGMGPQWWAMGRELMDREPVFRAAIERCDAELARYTGWSLVDALLASCEASRMDEAEVAQPANFAIQVALAELWQSWGVEPDAVIGHSTGEVAAQYLSGALSFEDAVKVSFYRSSLQQRTTGTGRMLAVGMTPETLDQLVSDAGPLISVAAVNSPSAVTLAGDTAILEDMARQMETFGVFHRFLSVKVPYHSHFMDTIRDDLLAGLADLRPRTAAIPLYSTVTGIRIDGSGVDANYWWQNVRGTVLFSAAFTQMIADGYTVFVELGPHPVLASSMNELLALDGQDGVVVPSLRRMEPERPVMLGSLGALYALGHPLNWEALYDTGGNFVRLPAYPWQLEAYWTESREAHQDRFYTPVHPLLGQRIDAAQPTWELEISTRRLPYLADHSVQENVLLPGAGFIEMALAAAGDVFGEGNVTLEDVTFRNALVLTDASDPRLRTVLRPDQATVEISSYRPTGAGGTRWTLHATARLRQRQSQGLHMDPDALRRECTQHVDREEFYARTAQMGFQYGAAFQAVQSIDASLGYAVGEVAVPTAVGDDDVAAYHIHPCVLDAAFQVLLTAVDLGADGGQSIPYLPVGIDRVRVFARSVTQLRVVAQVLQADARRIVSNIQLLDTHDSLVVEIEGFRAQSLDASIGLSPERIDKMLYELEWQPMPREAADDPQSGGEEDGPGTWLLLADRQGVAAQLARHLVAAGGRAVTVVHGEVPEPLRSAEQYVIDLRNPDHLRQLFATLPDRNSVTRVVHLCSLDAAFTDDAPLSVLEQDQRTYAQSVVHLMQAFAEAEWTAWPRIWLVTQNAQNVDGYPGPLAVTQAPLWGLGRVIGHQEFTSMWGGLVDLDVGPADEQAALLFDEIVHRADEDQVAFRQCQRLVLRLTASRNLTPPLPPSVRSDGSYLITGGLGSLGLLVARFLVESGATRLVLMARTTLPERSSWHRLDPDHPQWGVISQLLDLERLGATIHLAAVDVADEDQLGTWLAQYEAEAWAPIRGVIHVAGVVQDELLLRMSDEAFHRVLRPKVQGGWLLHRLLRDQPLDFFVLFSSTGSTIASAGQGNYAAANAFLDALAHHRRALGLPAVSISWGPWSVGMVEELKLEQFYANRGIDLITPETGMQIMARVLGQGTAHLVAISANWATARETSPMAAMPPLFSQLDVAEDDRIVAAGDADGISLVAALSDTPPHERSDMVTSHLQELAARVLQLDGTRFTEHDPLTSLGMDSMMAIEVKQRIEAALHVGVSVLELLQGVTIAELATRILESLTLPETAPDTGVAGPAGPEAELETLSMDEIDRLLADVTTADLEELLNELERDTN